MGTALAVDGFVIKTVKPDVKDLNGQDVSCYRNRKAVWGLISQVACDVNAKERFIQTDWPGATNVVSCFRGTHLFLLLKSQQLPHWMHIVTDEAYSPLSVECAGRILTPYSQHQLNLAKQKDWQN
jgi:dTDP-D-glucose 4,6-dehydratase